MFSTTIGKKGLIKTYQNAFPETVACAYCQGEARIGFVTYENLERHKTLEEQQCVCDLHDNDPTGKGYWLHDCCAVAVYFCKKCLRPTAKANQG